jgi:hypothetical protein
MSKEEKPLEYQRRILDTKGVVQRLDLDYLKKPSPFRDWKRKLSWLAPAVALIGVVPFVAGIGGLDKAFSNGPVSRAHSVFENNCQACHVSNFSNVPDGACKACHDGPPHPAKSVDGAKPAREISCATCHLEHRDNRSLSEVADGNCTTCHADLKANGSDVKLAGVEISGFRDGRHPEFSTIQRTDTRPLRTNHAVHMPAQPKTIRNMKLPMKCSDCHTTDTQSATGDLLPVTFDRHCRECHKRELEFDVYQVLGEAAQPAPHTKDAEAIHRFIVASYEKALSANPSLADRPLGRELTPPGGAPAWLSKVVRDSEFFLFERKCKYCHEYEGQIGNYPIVKKVAPILGHFAPEKPDGEPWLIRGEFSHRAHRAVDCSSCHRGARTSSKTSDVLIPKLADCTGCHGSSGSHLDRCSGCHLYHNKSKELDKDRRPAEELLGKSSFPDRWSVAAQAGVPAHIVRTWMVPSPLLLSARAGGAH